MMGLVKPLAIILGALLLSACHYKQENFRLEPTLYQHEAAIGAGREVAIYVRDQRPEPYLGKRWFGYGKASKVNLENNLEHMTRVQISAGLQQLGFVVVPSGVPSQRMLNITIQRFRYQQGLAFLSTKTTVSTKLELTLQNGPDRYYRQYEVSEVQDIIPTLESLEESRQINRVYSKVLNQILMDPKLLLALTDEKLMQ